MQTNFRPMSFFHADYKIGIGLRILQNSELAKEQKRGVTL